MSDSQTYDPVVVSSDGVTVEKRFEADEFPVPAIAFRIESTRDETVSVKIVDSVPDDVAVEDLGFHPEYGSEYWTIDDQQITFERDIDAGSDYTTVYGIRSTGTDNVEQFLTQPVIEMVDPPLEDGEGEVLNETSSDVVKDVISGESDNVPGLDEDDEEIETLNLKDPTAPEDAGGQGGADGEGGGSSGGTRVTHALLAEIKRGEIEDEILSALRQTLANGSSGGGGGGSSDGATDARIQHLQNEVSDIKAYTEALEEFLAENGTGEQVIEDFRSQLNSFQNELDEIQSISVQNQEAVNEIQSTVSDVDNRIDNVEGTVEGMQSTVSEVDESVGSVEGRVEEMDEEMGEVKGTVEELDNNVGSLEGRVGNIDGEVNSVEESLGSLEEEVEGLQQELQAVTEQVGSVDNVDEKMEEIETEIEELKQWREQLSSVIGGAGGGE